ncbi:hypothetical protein [Dietzia sp.]|uniref:hypothetical protein n=1 Tax=Dietzia sp. TaxID=1871616 RepID=UPI002FD9C061
MIAEKVGASFRYLRRTIHGAIDRISTPIIAIVCALGVIVPLALDAYKNFDARSKGWTKVLIKPGMSNGKKGN